MRGKRFYRMIVACMFLLSSLVVAQQDKRPLTNQDIIKMVKAGLPENTIVLAIQKSPNSFDTSPDALIALKEAGATQKILDAILQAQPSPTTSLVDPTTSVAELETRVGIVAEKESQASLREIKLGTYKAVATETIRCCKLSGSQEQHLLRIKIENIDKEGNIKAELNRLGTKSSLKGKINGEGNLHLKGLVVRDALGTHTEYEFTLKATVENKAIANGKYSMVAPNGSDVEGVFNVTELEDD